MVGPACETQGQISYPNKPTPTILGMEARRITRGGINDVVKRKRPDFEESDTKTTKSDNIKYLRSNHRLLTSLNEITTLIKTLK